VPKSRPATGCRHRKPPAAADGAVCTSSDDGNVNALNAATGASLRSLPTGGHVDDTSPALANGVVYTGSYDHNVSAFDLAGGLATPADPHRSGPHPDYSLLPQR
jgi:outer membrane protein assembly factor BamB